MPSVSTVEFWPSAGFPDRPWRDEPHLDAWVRTSRRVCELYSAAIKGRGLQASTASIRMFAECEDGSAVVVHAFAESGVEGARVDVPHVAGELGPLLRAQLVLDAIDLAMRAIGAARGWDTRVLGDVYTDVRDHGFRFVWAGREVNDPTRRRLARVSIDLADDGYGRCSLELISKDTGHVIGRSAPSLAYSTIEGFGRTAKSLRWSDRSTVQFISYSDFIGLDQRWSTIDVEADLHPRIHARAQLRPCRPVAEVAIPPVQLPPPPVPRIVGGSGGPTNDLHPVYSAATLWLYDHITDELTAWWARSGLMNLDVTYSYDGNRVGYRLYRHGDDLRATITRPMPDPEVDANPVQVAYEDVTELLRRVQKKLNLPQPPALPVPSRDDITALTASLAAIENEDDDDPVAALQQLPAEYLAQLPDHLQAMLRSDDH